jgi:L-aminopeptidase/D-esterase-like protein
MGALTDVAGLLVGHATDPVGLTGVTAVLCPAGAVAGVAIPGRAAGVLGLDVLDPAHLTERIHAVVLAGGSAFGLEACFGVMAHLETQGVGFRTAAAVVPIIVGAILYDLGLGDARARPDRAMGARAAAAAAAGPVAEGSVGAGTGATVGKAFGLARAMKGGVGTASRRVAAATVGALVAVNAAGDVRDPETGGLLAGARDAPDGRRLVDARRAIQAGTVRLGFAPTHSTIGVVATDAALTKAEAGRLAALAHGGLVASLSPPHLSVDGDTLFALSTGTVAGPDAPPLDALGLAAADAVAEAIVRGIRAATALGGLPTARDLSAGPA